MLGVGSGGSSTRHAGRAQATEEVRYHPGAISSGGLESPGPGRRSPPLATSARILTGMDIGVGSAVWLGDRPGVVVEGPDEGGQFLIEYSALDGGLESTWCLPGDGRVHPRET